MKELRIEAVYNHEYEKDDLIAKLIHEYPNTKIYVNGQLEWTPEINKE